MFTGREYFHLIVIIKKFSSLLRLSNDKIRRILSNENNYWIAETDGMIL